MLSIVNLNVIMLNAVMLSVVAPAGPFLFCNRVSFVTGEEFKQKGIKCENN